MPFKDYSHTELSLEEIKAAAAQYAGIDMWELIGKDSGEVPFLLEEADGTLTVMFWTRHSGLMAHLDEDPVRDHAFIAWLQEHNHPIFKSLDAARDYDWSQTDQIPRNLR